MKTYAAVRKVRPRIILVHVDSVSMYFLMSSAGSSLVLFSWGKSWDMFWAVARVSACSSLSSGVCGVSDVGVDSGDVGGFFGGF